MDVQTAMLATLIVILGAAQYALCVQALRDLVRRPRVRGENKVLWGLGILCVPIAGAIVYNWMGPTSFMHRPLATTLRSTARGVSASNVTPIATARAARRRRLTAGSHASRPRPLRRAISTISRGDRTGS